MLQGLVVANCAVGDVTWCTQLHVCHPMDHMVAKLAVESPSPRVTKVTDKVLKAQAGGTSAATVNLAVFPDDGRRDVMFVPRLESWVLQELVLESRDESLKWISNNEELEIGP